MLCLGDAELSKMVFCANRKCFILSLQRREDHLFKGQNKIPFLMVLTREPNKLPMSLQEKRGADLYSNKKDRKINKLIY